MLTKEKIEQMKETLKGGVSYSVAPQLFPTPNDLAERMADILELESSDQVLEPSAGTGNLLKACHTGDIVAIEFDSQLSMSLVNNFKKVNVYCGDFLDYDSDRIGKFDKVIMNPPFAKGQDIEHVLHAYSFLKSGGILCAVMGEGAFFRRDKKATAFREFLNSVTSENEKLPQGTFKSSGTMVNTRLLTIWGE